MSRTNRVSTAKSSIADPVEREMNPSTMAAEHTYLSSIYPWYYVPGRPYFTEKRLSEKYKKESRRRQENEEIHKYYM